MECTSNDCSYVLITKLPNGDCHQVLIDGQMLKDLINSLGEFKVLEDPIEGLEIGKPQASEPKEQQIPNVPPEQRESWERW